MWNLRHRHATAPREANVKTSQVAPVRLEMDHAHRIVWMSATPTAAPAADQPTRPSVSVALRSPTLPAPYPPAHTSDTTSTSRL
jgi:hypothetical protein